MADTPSSRSSDPPASQSTRELLEELDTLMQRMLALPVQGGDDDAATPVPAPSRPPPTPYPSASSIHQLHVPVTKVTVQAPGSNRPAQQVAAANAPALRIAPTSLPTDKNRDRVAPTEAAPTYVPVGAEPLLPMLLQRPAAPPQKRVAPPSPPNPPVAPAPRPLLPALRPARQTVQPVPPPAPEPGMAWLVALNWLFDLCTMLLGPLGGWLRGEHGRWLIGWSGIAMVIAAAIWAALRFFG